GKGYELADEATVNLLCAGRRWSAVRVEQLRPIDPMLARHRSEPDQVGEDRRRRVVVVQRVGMTDLRVPVAVGRVGELERDERFSRWTIDAAPVDEQALDQFAANQTREELLKDDGLIMPAQLAGRALEHVRVRPAAGAHAVDETV